MLPSGAEVREELLEEVASVDVETETEELLAVLLDEVDDDVVELALELVEVLVASSPEEPDEELTAPGD